MTRIFWCVALWGSILGMYLLSKYAGSQQLSTYIWLFVLSCIGIPSVFGLIVALIGKKLWPQSGWNDKPSLFFLSKSFGWCLVVALIGGVAFSKYYWNYYFFRPDVFSEVLQAKQVSSLARLQQQKNPGPYRHFEIDQRTLPLTMTMEERLSSNIPASRAEIQWLRDGKIKGQVTPMDANTLSEVDRFLDTIQISPLTSNSAHATPQFHGSVVSFTTDKGEDRIYLTLDGVESGNDHYGYYEMLFANVSPLAQPLKQQNFNYDIAGLEGVEWWSLAPLAAIGLFLVAFPLVLMATIKSAVFLQPIRI